MGILCKNVGNSGSNGDYWGKWNADKRGLSGSEARI